jgi:hypothetical protein
MDVIYSLIDANGKENLSAKNSAQRLSKNEFFQALNKALYNLELEERLNGNSAPNYRKNVAGGKSLFSRGETDQMKIIKLFDRDGDGRVSR